MSDIKSSSKVTVSSNKDTLDSSKDTSGSNINKLSLDSPIYKVKRLVNGSINTIYVFNGNKTEGDEELFKKVFTDEENQLINSENITVKFSDQIFNYLQSWK